MRSFSPKKPSLALRVLFFLALQSCGTYSHLRPADNLRVGQIEASAGIAINSIPELLPVFQISVGATDWLEVGTQYEVYSTLAWLRAQIFDSRESPQTPVSVAIEVGGGWTSILSAPEPLTSSWISNQGSLMVGLVVGRQFSGIEPYLANRTMILLPLQYVINSSRAGLRFKFLNDLAILGFEAGATMHNSFATVAEGTAFMAFAY